MMKEEAATSELRCCVKREMGRVSVDVKDDERRSRNIRAQVLCEEGDGPCFCGRKG